MDMKVMGPRGRVTGPGGGTGLDYVPGTGPLRDHADQLVANSGAEQVFRVGGEA